MSSHVIRWGILGAAKIAKQQVMPGIQEASGAVIQALASRDPAKGQVLAEEFGVPTVHEEYQALLEDPDVDAVYIPLPNHLHREWTIKAVREGKHVLCEKPLAITAEDCQAMIDAAEEKGVTLMEAFMYSVHPQIRLTLELLEDRAIGDVQTVLGSLTFFLADEHDIRLEAAYGGGSLMDLGCYPIHFANIIFRHPPVSVQAAAVWDEGIDRSLAGILRYSAGRLGIIHSSFSVPWGQRAEIVGSSGRIILERPWRADKFDTEVIVENDAGRKIHSIPANNPYKLEIEHFQQCLINRSQPLPSAEKGREVVRTIEALLESARSGRQIQLD